MNLFIKQLLGFIFVCLAFFIPLFSELENSDNKKNLNPEFLSHPTPWSDSLIKTMSVEEKIGQLFFIGVNTHSFSKKECVDIFNKLSKYKLGGLVFMKGKLINQIKYTNYIQSRLKIPMLIAMDAEWGMAMRLEDGLKYPWQMTIGASTDNYLVYNIATDQAKQLKKAGVHISFSPVVDVNSNPNNPIIGLRSFGESPLLVADKAIAFMTGLQHQKIIASGKHFPGHGNTSKDSHKELPTIKSSAQSINQVELFPFKSIINSGIASLMVGHLNVEAYNPPRKKIPSSLNPKIVDTLLKQSLRFKGLVFTDALNMHAITDYKTSNNASLLAFKAGCEALIFPENLDSAIYSIKEALKKKEISIKQIDRACLKILRAKEWTQANKFKKIDTLEVLSDFESLEYKKNIHKLYNNIITLLKNKDSLLPLRSTNKNKKIAFISINHKEDNNYFFKTAALYRQIDTFSIENFLTEQQFNILNDKLLNGNYEQIIFAYHNQDSSPWDNDKLDNSVVKFLKILSRRQTLIYVHFASPYLLKPIININFKAIVLAYQNNYYTNSAAAQVIFGGLSPQGRLPIFLSKNHPIGKGLSIKKKRLGYFYPLNNRTYFSQFRKIDDIAKSGITEKAYPGCQILVAHKNHVVYNKNFGNLNYDFISRVTDSSVYDVASITKIAATMLAMMELKDSGKIDINQTLGYYLPNLIGDTTSLSILNICEILSHISGLPAWIPFFKKTLVGKVYPNYKLYNSNRSEKYSIKVDDEMYLRTDYKDSIYKIIMRQKIGKKKYLYSDLGYYFIQLIIEKLAKTPLDQIVQKYYDDLGMQTTGYIPLRRNKIEYIAPTALEKFFRMKVIRGYVHDPGAAMLGGVAGHAGLFTSANDLAKLMQMYLQKGKYGFKTYLSDTVINLFTLNQYQFEDSRRALGFDKPSRDAHGPSSEKVSNLSYGHGGFTGCLVWVDPKYELIYIFLSNRVHPDEENIKLLKMNIRTKIQEVIYNVLVDKNTISKK